MFKNFFHNLYTTETRISQRKHTRTSFPIINMHDKLKLQEDISYYEVKHALLQIPP